MSGSPEPLWSNNPNAPQIPYRLYFREKATLDETFVAAILYGIVVVLFSRCIGALLNPLNRVGGGTKWGLMSHTVAMFSFITIPVAMHFNKQCTSYTDNRTFPGGPLKYQDANSGKLINIFPSVMFPLNQWLADGLLLYRCYVIYSMNYWAIAFPCLMYFASVSTGIAYIWAVMNPALYPISPKRTVVHLALSYYSICVSLTVLLTLMIVVRLFLHQRNIRNALGTSAGIGGLYITIVTMLVESYALYAVTFLVFIGLWAANNFMAAIFAAAIGEVQVIAPFLIILRVADRRALAGNTIVSGTAGTLQFKSQGESTDDNETLPEGYNTSSTEPGDEVVGKPGIGAENTVEEVSI